MSTTNQTKAYHEGYQAYRDQRGSEPFPKQGKNPYSQNSSDYWDWAKGWNNRGMEDALDDQYAEEYHS